jgi:nucleotidyltransferase/DNA polymerase involved in DNA repair
MRFACARIEHLPTRVEVSLQLALSHQPLVVLRAWDERVLDASPDAEASGVRPGDSRRRVEQLCPHAHAVVLPARESLYQSHHESLKSVLANFADKVEASALGEFFIEVGALARAFPSEQALAEQIVAQAHQAAHLAPAVGIAEKFAALQAALLRRSTAAPHGGKTAGQLEAFIGRDRPDAVGLSPARMEHRRTADGVV